MLKLEYTMDELEGQEGPNLYLMGSQADYRTLHGMIMQLINGEMIAFNIADLEAFDSIGSNILLELRSTPNGIILAKKGANTIFMDLDSKYWISIGKKVEHLISEQSHSYIEFDGEEMIEEMSMVWSSEW